MPEPETTPPAPPAAEQAKVHEHHEGIQVDATGEDSIDARLATIEMAGEEVAAGWRPAPHRPLAPEVRFLHSSRTIHQLVTDRNRSVGIFLLVASVLINASSGLLQVENTTRIDPIIPMAAIRYWCLPVTFGTLAVLGIFTSLLLIRTRIGLIYEVVKMNILLGLPSARVERVNPLSIFYLMHLMVAILGGASAGFTIGMLRRPHVATTASATALGVAVALFYALFFQALYYITILRSTTDAKLQATR
jgi:hypothetical protein